MDSLIFSTFQLFPILYSYLLGDKKNPQGQNKTVVQNKILHKLYNEELYHYNHCSNKEKTYKTQTVLQQFTHASPVTCTVLAEGPKQTLLLNQPILHLSSKIRIAFFTDRTSFYKKPSAKHYHS